MDYWPLMGKSVKVYGKGSIDHIKSLIDKEYNINELIEKQLILPEAKKFQSFSEVVINKDLIPKIPFIKKVLANGMDTEKMPRVQHDTIHKVKGLTFDNGIVDLSVYYTERGDEPLRLAYTAYSRGRNDCWSIGSSSPGKLSLAGIQANRRYYLE